VGRGAGDDGRAAPLPARLGGEERRAFGALVDHARGLAPGDREMAMEARAEAARSRERSLAVAAAAAAAIRAQPARWKSCFTSAAQQLHGAGF
jgi:hypothetical protein